MEDKIFNQIEQKFKELVFEIQMQDNKKIIEFQEKLKALKEKIALEEQIKKKDEYINILEDNNEKLVKENDDLLNNKKIEILDVEIAIHEIGYYRMELSETNEKLNNLEKLLKASKDS